MLIFFPNIQGGTLPLSTEHYLFEQMLTNGNDLRPLRVISKVRKSRTYARNFYMAVYPFSAKRARLMPVYLITVPVANFFR